jgi:hypothetical protein
MEQPSSRSKQIFSISNSERLLAAVAAGGGEMQVAFPVETVRYQTDLQG